MDAPPPVVLEFDAHGMPCDAGTVDILARLQLAVRRLGAQLSVVGASDDLRNLLVFAGLDRAVGLEPGREAEEGEERGGVEEEGELGDASV